MRKFADIGIKRMPVPLVGKKIPVIEVLNSLIVVFNYREKPSNYYESGICLHIQIEFENEKRVIFTGSTGLLYYLKQMAEDEFPFQATIIKDNKYYHFT
jgi:hypothetical protein